MKNIWNYLAWKYQRSTKGDLFYWSGILSWIPAWIGIVVGNQTLYWVFGLYAMSVFVIGLMYFTYSVLIKQDWEKYQRERQNLFNNIKTGK